METKWKLMQIKESCINMSNALYETEHYIVKSSSKLPVLFRFINCFGFDPKYTKLFADIDTLLPNRVYVNYNFYWPKEEYKAQMVEFEQKIEADRWFMERYVVRTLIFFQELDCLTEELKRSDFSKASNEAIAAKIKYIWEEQKRFIGGWYYSLQ